MIISLYQSAATSPCHINEKEPWGESRTQRKQKKKKRQTVDVSERQFASVILRIPTSHLQNVLNSAPSYFHWEHYDTGLGWNRWRRSANQKPPSTTSTFLMTSTYSSTALQHLLNSVNTRKSMERLKNTCRCTSKEHELLNIKVNESSDNNIFSLSERHYQPLMCSLNTINLLSQTQNVLRLFWQRVRVSCFSLIVVSQNYFAKMYFF